MSDITNNNNDDDDDSKRDAALYIFSTCFHEANLLGFICTRSTICLPPISRECRSGNPQLTGEGKKKSRVATFTSFIQSTHVGSKPFVKCMKRQQMWLSCMEDDRCLAIRHRADKSPSDQKYLKWCHSPCARAHPTQARCRSFHLTSIYLY